MGQKETKEKLSSATLYCIYCWSLASLIKDKAGRNNYLMTPVSFLLMWQQSETVGIFFFFLSQELSFVASCLLPTLGPCGVEVWEGWISSPWSRGAIWREKSVLRPKGYFEGRAHDVSRSISVNPQDFGWHSQEREVLCSLWFLTMRTM